MVETGCTNPVAQKVYHEGDVNDVSTFSWWSTASVLTAAIAAAAASC